MRKRRTTRVGLLLMLLAFSTAGCISATATPAVHGRAYVTKGSIFGTSMYNCAVVGGAPTCWRVTEKGRD